MKYELTKEKKIAYKQVLEVLNNMEKENVDKVPAKLIEFFKSNCDKDYIFKLNSENPLENQKLTQYSLAILAMLNINYWCKDEEEKKQLLNKYSENERKYQEELRIRYNPDNLFKNREESERKIKKEENIDKNKENLPIRLTWYEKIRSKIKVIFRKEQL